jgi:hypothetical protein
MPPQEEFDMRKIIPIVASALVAGAVGLVEQARRAKQAPSSPSRAAASAQHRSPRRSEAPRKRATRRPPNRKANKGT